jgi:hypothetical protein
VLVAGCDTCVAVCLTGGEKEAEILAAELRIKAKEDGREVQIEHTAAIRQCEWEYLDAIAAKVEEYPLVLSMACGIGIQSMAEKFAPRLSCRPSTPTCWACRRSTPCGSSAAAPAASA